MRALSPDPDDDEAAGSSGSDLDPAAARLFRHRVLSREEEQALFTRLAAGDVSARDTIVQHNMRLIAKIASPLRGRGLDWDDLIGHGCLGLLTAIEKFEPARGLKFSTCATWWIYQAITRGIDEESRTVRLPVHVHDRLRRMHRERARLALALGRAPDAAELAHACHMSVPKLRALLRYRHDARSLDTTVREDGDATLGDLIADPATDVAMDAAERVDQAALASALAQAFARAGLTDREQLVLRMRFGLGEHARSTLEMVGAALATTRERARQIERDALRKMRAPHVRALLEGHLEEPALELAS